MSFKTRRPTKTLVSYNQILHAPDTQTFFVPDVTPNPVKKKFALFHAMFRRPVFLQN